MTRIAIYPGSFDPVTNGHLDIIQRGSSLTDHLIVAVARNAGKSPMFSIDERIALLENEIKSMEKDGLISGKVTVNTFTGLLIDYAEKSKANMILRGLRAVTDFEYEFQMTGMNRRMNRDIETVFLMASERNQFIASSMVKEIADLDGDISSFVPNSVVEAIRSRGK
ncbi:MAG: pantetheine-phosphate adenylyltransferase [Alphaproteobacteria bacterium]|jgi:pantetheine-phosphate adenylyltransferase|nr:pantetheine-phosphate adenylyltransferase [Alphaproteobacteria bacterium]